MSYVYTSNSPEYLNYIAHTKTRNDIINDPRLCVLLEDPDIKDNMELALKYREAQYGDMDKKIEFVGFFLANGPELDTDTIMYFREKILHNNIYTSIYLDNFKNIETIDDLRINVYNKDTTDTNDKLNCLSNPCDYLGPFSSSIGLMSDDRNFNTLGNVFARLNGIQDDDEDPDESTRTWGNIPQHMFSKLIPSLGKAYRTMMASMSESIGEFTNKIRGTDIAKDTATFGDPKAEGRAKDISSAIRVNIISNLGDCSRIWEQMRRLRFYDPSSNAKEPFDAISKKTVDGIPEPNYIPQTDVELKPSPIGAKDSQEGTTNVVSITFKGGKEVSGSEIDFTESEEWLNSNEKDIEIFENEYFDRVKDLAENGKTEEIRVKAGSILDAYYEYKKHYEAVKDSMPRKLAIPASELDYKEKTGSYQKLTRKFNIK